MDIRLVRDILVYNLVVIQWNSVDKNKLLVRHYLCNYYLVHRDLANMGSFQSFFGFHDIGKMDHRSSLMDSYMLEYALKHGKSLTLHRNQCMDLHIYFEYMSIDHYNHRLLHILVCSLFVSHTDCLRNQDDNSMLRLHCVLYTQHLVHMALLHMGLLLVHVE